MGLKIFQGQYLMSKEVCQRLFKYINVWIALNIDMMKQNWFYSNFIVRLKNQMIDNVRQGRQSITKKISFHQKHNKNYKTIESIEKQPTKKKITLNQYQFKKESHPIINQSSISKNQERKIKSLTKYQVKKLSDSNKKKYLSTNQPELATIEGLLNRNMQMGKFSMSKERERIITKQKYKRSQQVRSLIQNKKMSSMGKYQRRDTENSNRNEHPNRSNIEINRGDFKQINLSTIINSVSGKDYQITLQDTFEEGCYLYYHYLAQKEQRLSQVQGKTTLHIKTIKDELNTILEESYSKFKTIHTEVGEMSCKNLLMIAAILFQQGKSNDVIMYIGRVLQKTDGNLFLIKLPGPLQKPNQSLTFLNSQNSQQARHYNLNFISYQNLAESYKNTNNYLCAINIINKCEGNMKKYLKKSNTLKNLKHHYQTLQPKQQDQFNKADAKQAIKKKSYMLSALRQEPTANKFKKHSHTNSHNFSSIDFNKSKNLQVTQRNEQVIINEKQDEQDNLKVKFASQKESLFIHDSITQDKEYQFKQYAKQLTALFLLLARSYIKIKSYDLAINSYKKCLQINPRKIEPLLQLASLYYLKYSSKKSLEWLEICIQTLEKEESKDQKWVLDYSYIKYHKSLIFLQQNKIEQSYQLFNSITVPELASQVNYYKGIIKLKHLNNESTLINGIQKNLKIQSILMNFNQAITAFTSKEYLIKSYFYILLILVFEKKDYYGAQYQVNRFKKIMPLKSDNKQDEKIGLSRISRIYEDDDLLERQMAISQSAVWNKDSYFNLLFDIIDGIICILKMKIGRGISLFKEVSLKIQSNSQQIIKYYGYYYNQIIKLLFQFKFYAYYILREYELSLKHVNKLLQILDKQSKRYKSSPSQVKNNNNIEIKLININKLMLQCIILMKQSKFNYAMSKLTEIESLLNQSNQSINDSNFVNSAFILNNFNMIKSLCYINLHTQLEHQQSALSAQETQDNNKEILLSAQELLRHCLISDKQNSLIYYLISVIYYQLQEYQPSLKYVRQALQYSDDHMIKHYFSKANTKFMLSRYDQAIKDYTNAIIVYKQQAKNDTNPKQIVPTKKSNKNIQRQQLQQEYYAQKQIMFHEIYLNRAITYIKYSYQLTENKNYSQNANIITSYKMKACEDLLKYFHCVMESRPICSEKELKNHLLLFMHTDDPSQLLEVNKIIGGKYNLIGEEDIIKVYYAIKELNNCIVTLRNHISQIQHRMVEAHHHKTKKDNLPPKHKKISMALPKKLSQMSLQTQKLSQLRFDLRCLQSLKKSSSKSQGALEQALISLLQMTQEIYRKREQQLSQNGNLQGKQNLTLENLFLENCGQIFKWSDILFFIGVIHFELKQYETAIKYFQQSQNQKKANKTLFSLAKYMNQVLKKGGQNEQQQQYLFCQLQSVFQNRIYCKEQLDYNIGISYLMLRKYKQAYYYLQNYPHFLMIIKKAITIEKEVNNDNQFMAKQPIKKKLNQILIDDHLQESQRSTKRIEKQPNNKTKNNQQKQINTSSLSSLSESVSGLSEKESELDNYQNITPFPTHNRLCSIYSPKIVDDKKFYLSFCLPKVDLPLLGLFHQEQVEPAQKYINQEQSNFELQSSRMKDADQQKICKFPVQKRAFFSVARHISLLDLQMKPIAPWIRQNTCGVIFTQNIINQSVDLNSQRAEKRKQKPQDQKQQGRKNKKERYNEYESKR